LNIDGTNKPVALTMQKSAQRQNKLITVLTLAAEIPAAVLTFLYAGFNLAEIVMQTSQVTVS